MKKTLVTLVLAALILGFAKRSDAQIQFYTSFSNFTFNTWNGQGDISQSQTGCIAYLLFGFIPVAMDYQMRVQMNSPAPSPGSAYRFYNIANNSYSFPFSISVNDIHAGGAPMWLNPNQYSNTLTYEPSCSGGQGPNAELTMSMLAADMYGVPAGNYRASTNAQARRLSGGSPAETATQTNLLGTITIPSLIMITKMNDIALGVYDGVSANVTYNEPFCVYTNASAYRITPSSTTTGAVPTTFALANGANRLEYTVRVRNTTNAASGTQLNNNQQSGSFSPNQSTPLSLNCNNGNNAAVYLNFTGPQLQAAPPGNYSGTLNLMVAPI